MRVERRAIKKLLLLGVGSALMFTMAGVGSAQADTDGTSLTQQVHKSTSVTPADGAGLVAVGGAKCAQCHRAHTAKAENLLMATQPALCYTCHGSLGSFLDVRDGVDPTANVAAGENKALRGGGFEYALIDGAGANLTVTVDANAHGGYAKAGDVPPLTTGTIVTSRHQIDGVTPGTMWGNGAVSAAVGLAAAGQTGVTLECGSCHDPHGNGNYRILKPVPNGADKNGKMVATIITPAVVGVTEVSHLDPAAVTVANPTGKVIDTKGVTAVPAEMSSGPNGVNIPDVAAGTDRTYTTGNYWDVTDRQVPTTTGAALSVKGDGTTDGYITNVSQWCSTCHTRYLAGANSYKTPLTSGSGTTLVTDATFTYRHRSNRNNSEGVSRPNCIQCHVSHGTNVAMTDSVNASFTNPAGLVPSAAGTPSAVGNSRLLRVDNRGTCQMCHNK